ncbi:MAG: hypothetical protein JWQ57_1681 [Mucilaginibacter sp.]|nr:hypothetical protein [Mucilaginibacter sp.]
MAKSSRSFFLKQPFRRRGELNGCCCVLYNFKNDKMAMTTITKISGFLKISTNYYIG